CAYKLKPTLLFHLHEINSLSTNQIFKFLHQFWFPTFKAVLSTPCFDFTQQDISRHKQFFYKTVRFSRTVPTQLWTRPPGVNHILINAGVKLFYKFFCGSFIFPTSENITPEIDFFRRESIRDGLFLNPPYDPQLLDLIIAKLVRFAYEELKTFAVLLPFWETAKWFKTLRVLYTPCFLLEQPLAFKRGCQKNYVGQAKFQSCIFLIGAYSTKSIFTIKNDFLGFPLNSEYIQNFYSISLPLSLSSAHGDLQPLDFHARMNVLHSILTIAEQIHAQSIDSDLTQNFNFDTIQKYNFLLQRVENNIEALNSQLWVHTLNPWIEKRVSWQPFKNDHRSIIPYSKLDKFLDSFESEPRQKYAQFRCQICRSVGHIPKYCPFKIPTIAELGLCLLPEKVLYNFLVALDFTVYKDQNFDHFESAQHFFQKAVFWISHSAKFWTKWSEYAQKHNVSDPNIIFHDEEFSKGRQALAFNYVMGAQLSELILDAFGATLIFVDPPPPCEYVKSFHREQIVDLPIDHTMAQEDEKEVLRRTQYIIPRKYIRYILPRFVVYNNDATSRPINDCRHLGPFTTKYKFRLANTKALRHFSDQDVILSIDGKSAYKQRKLSWSARNQIGFKTKINNILCYVAMASPPFGLHNAGFIYQKILEKKLFRASGNLYFIEYIDDITVKIASVLATISAQEWRINAFLWILTKQGEIFNNKFFVFQKLVTMLGVKYNL
ncbi:MAG TPA: hypothetical protein DDE71_02790, partial [Tenacibaculum sp.]|nr:hypothetical protein [Tenacibaculum sp.]